MKPINYSRNYGYINIIENNDYCIAYENIAQEIIVFFNKDKRVKKYFEQDKNQKYEQADSISLEELKAINTKIKELGWEK